MTPREANDEVERALEEAHLTALAYAGAISAREASLERLRDARRVLDDVLREAAGLEPSPDRREEYLRLHTLK